MVRSQAIHLFLLPKGKKTDSGYFHDFESHTRNVTLGLATTAETRDEDFIVLVDKVETAIVLEGRQLEAPERGSTTYGHKGGDLFAVLDELDTNAFSDGGVWLLGLDSDLLENDALCV